MPWINAEAKALLNKLNKGPDGSTPLYVTDTNQPSAQGRKVFANFADPEQDTVDVVYPHILVEMAGLNPAPEREHRGQTMMPYVPESMQAGMPYPYMDPTTGITNPNWDPTTNYRGPLVVPEFPIPYDMDFQVTVEARYRNHLEQLVRTLAGVDYFPHRFGYLSVPEDQTVRSLFLQGGPEWMATSSDENDKRLFSAVYLIRVATELLPWQVQNIQTYVTQVNDTFSLIPYS